MADALGSERSLLDLRSDATGFTYGHRVPRTKRRGMIIALVVITVLIAGVITLIYLAGFKPNSNSSPTPAPTDSYLLKIPHISLENISKISTFRSALEDYPGFESNVNRTCGCFRHWFVPFADLNFSEVVIVSPLQGIIPDFGVSFSEGTDDSMGYDIKIVGTPLKGYGEYEVRIGHVHILDHDAIKSNATLSVGMPLGVHIGNSSNSDITIVNRSAFGGQARYVSLFNVLDNEGLKQFQRWNISNRTYPVISDPLRKQHPLNCTGDGQIVNDTNWNAYPNWLPLNTSSPAEKERKRALRDLQLQQGKDMGEGVHVVKHKYWFF